MAEIIITLFQPSMLESWLRCRALAYMRSAFNDEITGEKEAAPDNKSLSLVALINGKVIGIADIILLKDSLKRTKEYNLQPHTPLATLDTMAVHPDYQGQGIAKRLLKEAQKQLKSYGGKLIIYTLSDKPANRLYQSVGAKLCFGGYIVYGSSPKNLVPTFSRTQIKKQCEVALFSKFNQEIPYAKNGDENYYVGQKKNIALLQNVTKVVQEHIYLLDLN